jgi:hypothetical protein
MSNLENKEAANLLESLKWDYRIGALVTESQPHEVTEALGLAIKALRRIHGK